MTTSNSIFLIMILGAGYVFRRQRYLELAAENSRVNMREKIYNQLMRRLHLQRHKVKVRETEVFGENGKGILIPLKGLTIDF